MWCEVMPENPRGMLEQDQYILFVVEEADPILRGLIGPGGLVLAC